MSRSIDCSPTRLFSCSFLYRVILRSPLSQVPQFLSPLLELIHPGFRGARVWGCSNWVWAFQFLKYASQRIWHDHAREPRLTTTVQLGNLVSRSCVCVCVCTEKRDLSFTVRASCHACVSMGLANLLEYLSLYQGLPAATKCSMTSRAANALVSSPSTSAHGPMVNSYVRLWAVCLECNKKRLRLFLSVPATSFTVNQRYPSPLSSFHVFLGNHNRGIKGEASAIQLFITSLRVVKLHGLFIEFNAVSFGPVGHIIKHSPRR